MTASTPDQIVAAVILGILRRADAIEALLRMGVSDPVRLLPAVHDVHVAPSPLVEIRRRAATTETFVDQWGRGPGTFVDGWRQVR